MSRTDGKYPSYTKIEVSPDEWPPGYWEKSRQCAECEFRWPYSHLFQPSPCCGVDTVLSEEPPSLRWPEAVIKLLAARFERYYEEYNEGVDDDRLPWEDVKTNGHYDEEKAKAEVDALLKEAQSDK